jgi:hypothetical protein
VDKAPPPDPLRLTFAVILTPTSVTTGAVAAVLPVTVPMDAAIWACRLEVTSTRLAAVSCEAAMGVVRTTDTLPASGGGGGGAGGGLGGGGGGAGPFNVKPAAPAQGEAVPVAHTTLTFTVSVVPPRLRNDCNAHEALLKMHQGKKDAVLLTS